MLLEQNKISRKGQNAQRRWRTFEIMKSIIWFYLQKSAEKGQLPHVYTFWK